MKKSVYKVKVEMPYNIALKIDKTITLIASRGNLTIAEEELISSLCSVVFTEGVNLGLQKAIDIINDTTDKGN